MKKPIFLDYQSTTPLCPEAWTRMKVFLEEEYGNPSSRTHCYGWEAREALETARHHVAASIGAEAQEIIFTSGATESINLALIGLSRRMSFKGHIITSNAEHMSVLETCRHLEKLGVRVSYLPVNRLGVVSPDQILDSIKDDTFLVSLIHANNEIGSLLQLDEIARICEENEVPLHTDSSQAFGRIPINVKDHKIGLLSLSAHKIYGPKGVGALFVSRLNPRVRIEPLIFGGGQELGLRGGTPNVAGIAAMGVACEHATRLLQKDVIQINQLSQQFLSQLRRLLDNDFQINGPLDLRLPGNLNLTFPGAPNKSVLAQIHTRLAVSTGSSCSSESSSVSHVLKAIGLSEEESRCTLRLGIGRFTTLDDVEVASQILADAVIKARNIEGYLTPSPHLETFL